MTLAQLPRDASRRFDFAIIGAGAVGLVMAVTLARAGRQVLLLESGSIDDNHGAELNDSDVSGRKHDGVLHGRARMVGGTTSLWGGQLTRFVPYDFDARPHVVDAPWPVGYAEIEPYYARVAELLGLDVRFLEDAAVLQATSAAPQSEASRCEMFFTRWLKEPHLGRYFARELRDSPGLWLAPECHLVALSGDSQGRRLSGVQAVGADGSRHEFSARHVILACGTLEISRQLLLAGAARPEWSWTANDNIGRYFQDHLDLILGAVQLRSKRQFADKFENLVLEGRKYQPKIRLRTEVLRRLQCLNTACTIRFDSSIGEDLNLLKQFAKSVIRGTRIDQPWKTIKRMVALGPIWFPLMWRYVRHRRVMAIADRGISVIAHCEQRPLRDSRIRLSRERRDRFGLPLLDLDWRVDEPMQLQSLQAFAVELQTYLQDECDASLSVSPAIAQGRADALDAATDSYHQCGGARMARSAESGVVDADCRVFGTDNLYVAGAAVFPSASFANPTFTAMAFACRLADTLLAAETLRG